MLSLFEGHLPLFQLSTMQPIMQDYFFSTNNHSGSIIGGHFKGVITRSRSLYLSLEHLSLIHI